MRGNSIVSQSFVVEAGRLPSGEPLHIRGDVRFAAEGPSSRPALLICHGFKAFKDWGFFPYIADYFAEYGYYTVLFDFSCNGVKDTDFDELEKFAVNTYSLEQNDIEVVLQALNERSLPSAEKADIRRLALLGHSRGGGNSVIFAAHHPQVRAVITWNGIASVDLFDDAVKAEIAEHGIAYTTNARTKQDMPIRAVFYEDLEQNKERFDIVRHLSELAIPVLQVQGDQDSARILSGFEKMRAAAPRHQAVSIEGGTHTFGAVHPFTSTTLQLEQALKVTLQFLSGAFAGS